MGAAGKREVILKASSRLFAGKGYDDTTTSEIARKSGVAEGTLYHHFDGKDDIFLTILHETIDGFLEGIDRLLEEDLTGAQALSALIRFHFDYVGRHANEFLVIARDAPPGILGKRCGKAASARAKLGRITTLLMRILVRGTSDGTLRLSFPARDTAEMLRGIFYGNIRLCMLGIIRTPLPRLAQMVETLCLEALAAPPGGGGRP